jgi:hypothetical protein
MEHACLPKDRPHNLLQSDAPWPMFGMPKQMLVGPNFTAQRLNAAVTSTASPSSTAPSLGHITAAILSSSSAP